MVDVVTHITIHAPVDKVASFAAEPDNAPKWYKNIKSVTWKTQKPLSEGSLIAFTAHFMGRTLEYTYKITKFIPLEELVMQTSEGPFPMQTTYTWKQVDNNDTYMTLRNTGSPTGFSKLFAPFMSMMMKNANNKDLQQLKEIIERNIEV
jgi:uncharacterized membrane protein